MESYFAEVKIFRFWPKTMDYSQVFFLASPKKVLRKVCRYKGNEKRNLMALVSVAWHIRAQSYKRIEFLIHSTFEWGAKSGE